MSTQIIGSDGTSDVDVPTLPSASSSSSIGLPQLENPDDFTESEEDTGDGNIDGLDLPNPPDDTDDVRWGIIDDVGSTIIDADSVLSFEYKNSHKISTYVQEKGAFQAYNKVKEPFDIRVKFAMGASVAERTDFLKQAESALNSLDLYTVVTPDFRYPNANIQNISYRRETKQGATMIILEVWLTEIRTTEIQSNGSDLSENQVKSPSDSSPVSIGSVQPQPVDSASAAAVCSKQSPVTSFLAGALVSNDPTAEIGAI